MSWIDKLLGRKSNQPTPDTSSKSAAASISGVEPPDFKCQVEEGGAINQLAVKHQMFSLGESKAFLVTFPSPPPTLSLAGGSDVIEVSGQLICHSPCFNAFPFEIEFGGATGGGEIRCPVCGSGYGVNFGYRRIGDEWNGKIDKSGFFFWFSPYTRGPYNEFVRELKIRQVQVKLVPAEATAPKASSPQATRAVTTPANFQTFTSSDNSFRIAYPGDWQQLIDPLGAISMFTSQDDQKVLTVIALKRGTSQADPATAVLFACSQVGGTPGSSQTVSIGGQSWTKVECDYSDGSNHLVAEAVLYEGNFFSINYHSPKAAFDSNASQFFTPMEQSFQFLSVKPARDMNSCSYCGNSFQVLRPGAYLDTAVSAMGDIILRTQKGCGACGIPVCFDCAASAADKKGLGGHCVCPGCGANLDS